MNKEEILKRSRKDKHKDEGRDYFNVRAVKLGFCIFCLLCIFFWIFDRIFTEDHRVSTVMLAMFLGYSASFQLYQGKFEKDNLKLVCAIAEYIGMLICIIVYFSKIL